MLCERFSSKAIKISFILFDVELFELHQRSDEALIFFYKWITSLMQHVNVKDKSTFISFIILMLLKSAMLNTILQTFIKEILNHIIQRKITRNMIATDKLLKSIYNLAEKMKCMNLKIQKLFNEEIKSKELIFYKNLIERNMFKSQINMLMTAYHSMITSNQKSDWTFHSDSSQF